MRKQTRLGSVSHIQLVVLLWAAGVATLFGFVLAYDNSYTLVGSLPNALNVKSEFADHTSPEFGVEDWHLEFFIHPECPCTRTSLKLVERLWNELPAKPKLTIYVASYSQLATPWNESSNFLLASKLGHANILEDKEAGLAKMKGATASGTIVVLNSESKCLFIGGISSSRSCDDPNSSYFAVRDLLTSGHRRTPTSPIYGCEF